jgi:CRP-like cAMP-binding protein
MNQKEELNIFFQDFDETEINEILEISKGLVFEKEQLIFKENDISDSFYIIYSGEVQVFASNPDVKEEKIAILGLGNILGEVGFIDGMKRTASAKAIDHVEVLSITSENFLNLQKSNIKLAIKVFKEIERLLSDRLRNYDELLVDFHSVKVDTGFLDKVKAK